MDDFPSNSIRGASPKAQQPKEAQPTDKKIERVTRGKVERRRKPLGKRFHDTFVGGDARSVWSYITLDVLIPAAKDAVSDAVSQGIERMLFGDSRPRSRRGSSPSSGGYVSYNRYSGSATRPPWDSRREEPRREVSTRGRANHDFDEIFIDQRGDADEVIDRLTDLVSQYGTASVSDLYELVGVTGSFTDNKWGWTDLRGAGVTRVRNGYVLDLPRPEPLD